MVTHFIFLSSSYSLSTRIAMDYIVTDDTQLELQKLVYLCFADCLCDTGKALSIDKIYAFKYGPVIDTIYKIYKVLENYILL